MRVEKTDDFVSTVTMTKEEADTLYNAITIAKTVVANNFIATSPNVDVEYIHGMLAGIAGVK